VNGLAFPTLIFFFKAVGDLNINITSRTGAPAAPGAVGDYEQTFFNANIRSLAILKIESNS
jgi:hypothetical protein